MNILILHPNFPGQYMHLAPFLAKDPSNRVVALATVRTEIPMPGVRIVVYKVLREPDKTTHPYAKTLEAAILDGQAVFRALKELQYQGFVPDVVIGHTGWGSTLFIKELYPQVPVIGYFEWFYNSSGGDVGYFASDVVTDEDRLAIRARNAHHLLNLASCDVAYCPTQWQKQQFPLAYREAMRVIHEGIDTDFCHPQAGVPLILPDIELDLSATAEVITYVSRGFEAYRGFPQFMDALRLVLKRRPQCHAVLVGADRVCYGRQLEGDDSYKRRELAKGDLDMDRVHFVGVRNRGDYLKILQNSAVHVYLTRPFVLSWSMLEAMAIGCPLVASNTPPVAEVVTDGENGLLADFQSPAEIADQMERLLTDRALAARLGKNARETVLARYALQKLLPQQAAMVCDQVK